ncbi:protein ENHANCER OF LHP1 1 [Oryza glaberrima]|uniref:protein ENHANCER OF LHP1 1 n=1 Tax=Oryza glaberrima TaxID=4538 RepID=UPI00224BF4C9|nr:protein ENHANCER OF LHP1 1 [Oryza glaberrima]
MIFQLRNAIVKHIFLLSLFLKISLPYLRHCGREIRCIFPAVLHQKLPAKRPFPRGGTRQNPPKCLQPKPHPAYRQSLETPNKFLNTRRHHSFSLVGEESLVVVVGVTMKGRAVKLREAHKAGSPVFCSVAWGQGGQHVVTASAADVAILIHDAAAVAAAGGRSSGSAAAAALSTIRLHKDGVTALAVAPGSGASLASGSIDHSVKFCSFPEGVFQSNIARFTLPIRSLAFNKKGTLLAAAGDDDGIKLIATIDNTISKVLKGHKGSVTGLSFDPRNDYLASIDTFGTVIFWDLCTGTEARSLKRIAPTFGSDHSINNALCWSPDGQFLAVPGLRNNVVMYDKDTGEEVFTLKGEHEQPVCSLCWSPNGRYLVTAGLDKQVLIWDVKSKQDVERQKFDERICSLAWKPEGNAVAVIDVTGRFGIWESVIPSTLKSPTEGAPDLNSTKVPLFDDEDDEERPSTSGGLDDDDDDESLGELGPFNHKRLRRKSTYHDHSNGDSEDEDLILQMESRKRMKDTHRDNKEVADKAIGDSATSVRLVTARMQTAFQPGSTPPQPGKRNFLAYNMLGSITTIENEGHSHVEVDFHDTGRGPRVPSMTDYFGFTMAALNESGSVFANPCKGDKNMSTLMYRPFSSWAGNSEWSMRFEGEEVKAVAVGAGWVAAVTTLNFLRIFTEGGLQMHILSVGGPVVTAAGHGDQLAIVSHASDCLSSGDQVLDVKVLKISECAQSLSSRFVLTPASKLSWFGFSENGELSSFDSKGILRVFSGQFGGSWIPIFSSIKARKSEDESHWVVGLDANNIFCILCKSPESYPQVMPKPVLTILELSFPLASSDLGANSLETEFMMRKLHLSQIQKKIEEMAALGLDTIALDDEAFNMEAALDRCILRLISSCCNGDKLVRATELAKLLTLEKSMKGALMLVTRLKLPILQERFSAILEEMMLNNAKIANTSGVFSNSNTNYSPSPALSTQAVPPAKVVQNGNSLKLPTLPKLNPAAQRSNPTESNKAELEQADNLKEISTKVSPAQTPLVKIPKNSEMGVKTKKDNDGASHATTVDQNPKGGSGQVGLKNKSVDSCNGVQPQRPVNPFAKSSSSKEQPSSLFDSIKKTKVENEKVDKANSKKVKV